MKKIKTEIKRKIFEPGQVLVSDRLLALSEKKEIPFMDLLQRHVTGDWGEVTTDEKMSNVFGYHQPGGDLKGRYKVQDHHVIIITAPDRSKTMIMHETELFYRPLLEREHHEEIS